MKYARKLFALLLVVLLCLSIGACSKKQEAAVTPPAFVAPQQIMLGEPMIGVIYPGTYDIPGTYSYDHHQDILLAMNRTGMDAETQLLVAENVADDRASVRDAVALLTGLGANVIFSTEFNYSFHMLELAEEYPNTIFCQLGGTDRNGKNLVDYYGEMYKSYYLTGTLAGMMSLSEETDSIGFVSAYGMDNPDAVAAVNAFTRGVRSLNIDATVYLKVLDAAHDYNKEEAAARALVTQQGCGFLASYTNTSATLAAAEYLDVPACGPYFHTADLAPRNELISPQFNGYKFYSEAIKAAQNSTYAYEFGNRLGTARFYPSGIGTSLLDVASLSKREDEMVEDYMRLYNVIDHYLEKCAPTDPADPKYNEDFVMRKEGIFSGHRYDDIHFDGGSVWTKTVEDDFKDNAGNTIVPAGGISLTTDQIRSMDFYAEGIVVVSDAP